MSRRRVRRVGVVVGVALALLAIAALTAAMRGGSGTASPTEGPDEGTPAFAAKLAVAQAFAPPGGMSQWQEGGRTAEDDEWLKRSIPDTDIESAVIERARADWRAVRGRQDASKGQWRPLGPTWAKGLPNPYRDRAVYNAGTPDFSGRIAHAVIDPNCGSRGRSDRGGCRLWIANANGGVWRANNALSSNAQWAYVSEEFEHNNVASLELDPNDRNTNTLWAGTGEPNACGSGCEAGVGLYRSTNGGNNWEGPFGREAFHNRAVGSIEVKPGNSSVIFAASGRAIRGLSNSCCGGADALIPGAPHFGLYRSQDGGRSWELVNQGATVLCTAEHPDIVSLNQTACSPRGARRVRIDPVDPNTVYASFFGRGIWRSRANGDPGTWEQIMLPVTALMPPSPAQGTERAEFDVVRLPSGETRMYVGVGGTFNAQTNPTGYARFRRNDNVRSAPAAAVQAAWLDLTSPTPDTPGYSSYGYCDPQCAYDNYVYVPATHAPGSGADHNTVYLSGDNEYSENNWGPNSPRANQGNPATGRSNGRGVLLTTNAGAHFTDMTDDTSDDFYPVELHPDHHALVVNPRNWRQFFDVGDGGVVRSNGVFVNDSGDCVQPKGYTGSQLTFCQLVLSVVPQRLETLNEGLRTLHFYQLDYSPHDPTTIVGGTQDNGSWERGDAPGSGTNDYDSPTLPDYGVGIGAGNFPTAAECLGRGRGDDDDNDDNGNRGSGGEQVWVNTNIADGGHNGFDKGDPCFRLTSWQLGQMMVHYDPKNQLDANWIADTQFIFYGRELNAFIGVANDDPVHDHWLWSAREHVFRSTNQGRNPILTKETHRQHCNVWYGDADVDDNGVYEPPKDICDDWKPLGDPGPAGRLTGPAYGTDKVAAGTANYVSVVERARDSGTLWAATGGGRVFVSKNADNPVPTAVVFDRIDNDPTAGPTPPRFVTAIHVDENDPNHAWITYSGFNAKTPGTPGHVFEVRYVPGASTFRMLDGNEPRDWMGDIPANAIAVTPEGWIYVGTDYGCVASNGDGRWIPCGKRLPTMPVADLVYVRERQRLYAATHGQGVWELRVG